MPNYQISHTFELKGGEWWLPGHEDKAIPGKLSYTPDEIELEVHGLLGRKKAPEVGLEVLRSLIDSDLTDEIPAIHGKTGNEPCSLLNCSMSGFGNYRADLLIYGCHVSSLDQPCQEVVCGSTLHERFFKSVAFKAEQNKDDEKPWSLLIEFMGQPKTCYDIGGGDQLFLASSTGWSQDARTVEVHNDHYFKLVSQEPKPLAKQLATIWNVCHLLTLLTDEAVSPTYCDAEFGDESGRVFYTEVEKFRNTGKKGALPLFSMKDVEDCLKVRFRNGWRRVGRSWATQSNYFLKVG